MTVTEPSVLFSEGAIRERVQQLGAAISRDFAQSPSAPPLHLVGVMKGALFFLADLARAIDVAVEIDVIRASSYGDSTSSGGAVSILKGAEPAIQGRHVILVEDIVDTGRTATALLAWLSSFEPKTLRLASLLDKPSRREVEVAIDYLGFEVPHEFLVGYGLDHAERYRNLRYIGALPATAEAPTDRP